MKQLLTVFCLTLILNSYSQVGTFIDQRDGQVYSTIVIGNKKWFREHLRFQTGKSFCPNFNNKATDCKDGNYYSNSELQTICPPGWHVATIPEWEAFIRYTLKLKNLDSLFKYDTARYLSKHWAMQLKGVNLTGDSLLNLKPVGWVQGSWLKEKTGLSLWMIDTETNDDKFHLHGGKFGFVKHSHEHHLIDKPSQIRKFPVRCVCEQSGTDN